MSMNNKIRAAVLPVVSVCVPDLYTGEETTYCTFQYTELPQAFSDDAPQAAVYLVQVHLFAPRGENTLKTRRLLRKALLAADFTAPQVGNASDSTGQHYIFECEYAGGWNDGD